jgi:GNAT superfamily N-acetyltransferase
MALNLADWQRSSIQHFGIQSFYTNSLWWRQPGGSGIYLGALIYDAQTPDDETFAELQAVEKHWGAEAFGVYDCWGTRDLTKIGFRRVVKNPWYLRPPGIAPALDLPEGLSIEIATTPQQLADFERASWEGFEEPDDPEEAFRGRQAFSQHPAGTLSSPPQVAADSTYMPPQVAADSTYMPPQVAANIIESTRMYYLNARLDGEVVAGVIIHATQDMMGVYGISTLPRFRRRGYASALMRAAVALRPDLPMSVFPDPDSLPIYSVLGFERAGEIAIWNSSAAR